MITNFIASTVLVFTMLAPVQFDNDLLGMLYKIENVGAKWHLAAKMVAQRL